jgi:hypothetical protein
LRPLRPSAWLTTHGATLRGKQKKIEVAWKLAKNLLLLLLPERWQQKMNLACALL